MGWMRRILALILMLLFVFSVPWLLLSDFTSIDYIGIVFCLLLVLFATLARAMRAKVLMDFASKGTIKTQFISIAIGSLFNAVLPLRLGELARAIILKRRMNVSLTYSLVVVAIERLVDLVLVMVGLLSLAVFSATVLDTRVAVYAITGLIVAVLGLLSIVLLVGQNTVLLRVLWQASRIWNAQLAVRIKLSLWALIHGLQRFIRDRRAVGLYLVWALLSWISYLGAVAVVFIMFSAPFSPVDLFAPFGLPESLFRGGSLESLLKATADSLTFTSPDGSSIQQVVLLVWLALNLPISVAGAVMLFFGRFEDQARESRELGGRYSKAKAAEMEDFLDSFYQSEKLARNLHSITLEKATSLVRFFKGGSDAITTLVRIQGELFIRKIVNSQHRDKLNMQYEWLTQHGHLPYVAEAVRDGIYGTSYTIDIAYKPHAESLFSWIHRNSIDESSTLVRNIFSNLEKDLYETHQVNLPKRQQNVERYIEDRFVRRLENVSAVDASMSELIHAETMLVNGVRVSGVVASLKRILSDKDILGLLSSYRPARAIHGDLTVDNILIDSAGKPILIDPSDDNQVRGPVIDFARMLQSLEGGYEFLNEIDASDIHIVSTNGEVSISFPDLRSSRYMELSKDVRESAKYHLTTNEVESLDFHVGLLYSRMLEHRIAINPATAPAYLATSAIFLDRFINGRR